MAHLNPAKLHTTDLIGEGWRQQLLPRVYTLTHSDATGDLFLTIDRDVDRKQISGWYTRFMRDEVWAKWQENEKKIALHVYVHVSGGLVLGTARWRDQILRHHMPQVIEAFRYGDRNWVDQNPDTAPSPVLVHFSSHRKKYNRIENYGIFNDYKIGVKK